MRTVSDREQWKWAVAALGRFVYLGFELGELSAAFGREGPVVRLVTQSMSTTSKVWRSFVGLGSKDLGIGMLAF